MKNVSHYFLFLLLTTAINLHASDYDDYYDDYENVSDDGTIEVVERDQHWDPRWKPIEDIPENPQLPHLIETQAPLETIIYLLNLIQKVESDNPIENRLLHVAVKHRHAPLVDELLRRNTDVNFHSRGGLIARQGDTALHIATNSSEENIIIVQKLVQHGADVNARDIFGSTPLHNAASNGHNNTVEYLLAFGADRTINGGIGANIIQGGADHTPARAAAYKGFLDTAELITNWTDQTIKEPERQ